MKNKKKRPAKKRAVNKKTTVDREQKKPDRFIFYTVLFMTLFILADFLVILYFNNIAAKAKLAEASRKASAALAAIPYKNPEFERLKTLPIGGTLETKLPVVNDLKFTMSDEPMFSGRDPIYAINVCCPAGLSKDYYTAKMPWAFIMYDFEPGLPTVVLFEFDSNKKTARFEIVILDPRADMEKIKAVSVRIFTELLKEYKPGFTWRGNVRQEIN